MHLWIIMDWNRRWAKKKLLPSLAGHLAWFNNAKKIAKLAYKKWVKYLTLWALSKENLVKRNEEEIVWIISLIEKLKYLIPTFKKSNIKFETIGDIDKLPQKSIDILIKVKNETSQNTWLVVVVALVYSWQDEIVRAIKTFIKSWEEIDNITPEIFRKYVDTYFLPPPDLIIRTGWDIRHSGFMLYDSDYSEYFFSEKMWPDFDEKELDKALDFFRSSKRNFWK